MSDPADGPPADAAHDPALLPEGGHLVVDAALDVVRSSIAAMTVQDTRELLDPPPVPFRYRALGDTRLGLYPVVLGTGAWGGVDDAGAAAVLDAYRRAGGNAVDSTSGPGDRAQRLLGAWLQRTGLRDRVLVVVRIGVAPDADLSAASLTAEVEGALTRLGTDRIDVLVLGRDHRTTPLAETLTAADALVRAGSVRYLGVGDYSAERLIDLRIASAQLDLPMVVAAQPRYSLVRRVEYEQRIAPVALAQGLGTMPRSPLGSGFLAGLGSSRPEMRRLRDLDPVRAERVVAAGVRRGARVQGAVARIARVRSVPASAVALAWLLTRPGVVAPVAGAADADEVAGLAAAARLHLTRSEVTALERASD